MTKLTIAILSLCVASSTLAGEPDDKAPALLTTKVLPLNLAMTAARAAFDACAKHKVGVSVAIVDRSGLVKTLAKGDGAGAYTLDAARRKAYTAANIGLPTGKFEELLRAHPDVWSMRQVTDILVIGGGLPILAGSELIGGIGVSGAPSTQADEECAQSGIDAIKRSLTP